jgi:hypothetical protein
MEGPEYKLHYSSKNKHTNKKKLIYIYIRFSIVKMTTFPEIYRFTQHVSKLHRLIIAQHA